ncbi:glycoside hydrolase superfamily [Jimgerdemannia flammicorona]|uniref:chitinase n=1 Tax=Jimgerdemannia flammicorona TaxID=994334 RepID=A0A433DKF0_9FUNG|nr:glycoside hydrolase superfamily [Jimgerdemannia flammicorona]
MRSRQSILSVLLLLFTNVFADPPNLARRGPSSGGSLALYWGQNPGPSQGYKSEGSLASYCQDSTVDIIIISFLNGWRRKSDGSYQMAMNLAVHTGDGKSCNGGALLSNGLPKCPGLEADIKTCQAKGKKVLIALGGSIPDGINYGLASDADGKAFATAFNQVFLGDKSKPNLRPFGTAVLDGLDLDIEQGSSKGYAAFTLAIKKLSPSTIVAAAPQCPIPDRYLQDAMVRGRVEYIFMQFYNNPGCAAVSGGYNYKDWANLVRTKFGYRSAKLFVGLPSSPGDAPAVTLHLHFHPTYSDPPTTPALRITHCLQGGYANIAQIKHIIDITRSGNSDVFGGIAFWEASTAFLNKQSDGQGIAQGTKKYLSKGSTGKATPRCTKIYVTKSGDKCSKISKKKKVSKQNLAKWNPRIDCIKSLPTGHTICLR